MKNLLLLAILLVPGIVFSQTTETRQLSSFTNLQISGSFDVIMEHGNEELVRIEAGGIDSKKIITEIKGNTLKVYLEKGNYQNIQTKVYITYKTLDAIDRSGSGDLDCKSGLSATSFKLTSSGSGDVNINGKIKAKHLDIRISGSGDARLAALEANDFNLSISGSGDFHVSSGNAKEQSLRISGDGDINAFGVKSEICSVAVSGSGDVKVTANKFLQGVISGSGDISYKGDAQVTKNITSGSGRIRKV